MLHRHIHRYIIEDVIYFITTTVRFREPIFAIEEFSEIVRQSIRFNARIQHCNVYAYVIMPDHLHILLRPTKSNISEVMRSIKTNSSREIRRYASHTRSRGGATSATGMVDAGMNFQWQKSFHDHIIRDEVDLAHHIEYIRQNPIRSGLVDDDEEYPFLYIREDLLL